MMALAIHQASSSRKLTLGVAACNTSFRTLALGEVVDSQQGGSDLKALESLVVQVGARECLVMEVDAGVGVGGNAQHVLRAVQQVMKR